MIGSVVEADQAPLLDCQATFDIAGDSSDRLPEVAPETLGGPGQPRIVALKQVARSKSLYSRETIFGLATVHPPRSHGSKIAPSSCSRL
jgi:hypothetical protein